MRAVASWVAGLVLLAVVATTPGQGTVEKSDPSDKKVTVTLKNSTAKTVRFLWVDFDGKEIEYGKLDAGKSQPIETFSGHLWRFRVGDALVGKYRASENAEQTYVILAKKKKKDGGSAAVTEPPAEVRKTLKLSPFYKKYVSVKGLAVVSSEKVSDKALQEAAYLIGEMLIHREDVLKELTRNKVRFAVMSPTEQTTDIPEHSDLTPKDYWNKRARGLGATPARPAVSCGEENLLNLRGDRYNGESILVHEFAHAIHEMGLRTLDAKFDARLKKIFTQAMDKGLWKKTYAATNAAEYWAEAVQSYFDTNLKNDSQHNDVDTREKLAKYDPDIYALIDESFKSPKWRYVRYDKRRAAE